MPKCLYCGSEDVSEEHHLPRCMGKFKGYIPLKDRVCLRCNGLLGKLDEQLCNSGFEAFFRRFLGLRGRKSHKAINPFYRGSSGGGRLAMVSRQPGDGKEIQLEVESGGTVRQLRHVSLVAEDDSVYIIPITDGMTPKQFRAKFDALGVKRFKEGDVYADSGEIPWVQQLLATLKFDKQTDWTLRNVGPVVYNGAAITVTVNSRYFRDIAKIGFHYFLTKMPQFTGSEPCFADLRAFIMSDCSIKECERFISLSRQQISFRKDYDLAGTVQAFQEYLQRSPDDRIVRLRLSLIGINRNRPDLVDAKPASMPPVTEVDARTGRVAVQVMKLGGYPNEALEYAYELLRLHFDNVDAHFAFTLNLHPIHPGPTIREFTEVEPGCAVCYVEEGQTDTNWIIIEDAANPDAARSEYGPQHGLSQKLMGKKVGEQVVLAQGSVSSRVGIIKAIQSKYVFRYLESLKNWQLRFPDTHAVESVTVHRLSGNGKEEFDFSTVFASVEELASSTERLKGIYASQPVPIHMLGGVRGKTTLETPLFLAQEENAHIFCSAGSPEEIRAAADALDVSNTWVLEPSAIATVFLLDLEDIITQLPTNVVLAQGSEDELDELVRADSLFRGEGGVLAKTPGGIAFVTITPEQRAKRLRVLQGRIDKVKSKCKIVGCVELARMEKGKRDLLIRALGQGGTESIVLASSPGHLLWTDDLRLAALARTEHGVKSVWTQAVLYWAFGKGLLTEEQLSERVARLIGYGYSFTSPSLPALVASARIAEWNPGQWPFSKAVELIGSETIHLRDAATLTLGIVERAYRETILDERRRSVLTAFLDSLGCRPNGARFISEIKRAVPAAFGLNVIGISDAIRTIDGWFKVRAFRVAPGEEC